MRRIPLLLAVVLVAGAGAAYVLSRDPGAPFPTAGHVREHGFAAWPADTVEEAKEECDGAPAWRHDARSTAYRFASEVMGYPDPGAGDYSHDPDHARFLVGTDGVRGLFLGALVELTRYGRCWYVVDGEPREGGPPDVTLGFVYRDGRPHLLLSGTRGGEVPEGRIGYGGWDADIPPGRSTVVELPELDDDATGHAIYLNPEPRLKADGLVSEGVGVDTLGAIPPPPSGAPAAPLDERDRPELCASVEYWARSPEGVIRRLLRGGLENLFLAGGGFGPYEPPRFRPLRGEDWRIVVGRAVMDATIEEAGRCARLVSIDTVARDAALRRVWFEPSGATFGVDWGGADDAYVELTSRDTAAGGTFRQIRDRITLPWTNGPPAGTVSALTVLYKDEEIVSVSFDLYPAS